MIFISILLVCKRVICGLESLTLQKKANGLDKTESSLIGSNGDQENQIINIMEIPNQGTGI